MPTMRWLIRASVLLVFVGPLAGMMAQYGADDAQAAAAPDADRGRQAFQKRCTGCHSLDQDREGPRLRGVYGRKAASVPGFPYSDGLRSAAILWDDDTLEKWLADPDAMVRGNDMGFRVSNAEERADVVRYLRLLSEKH